MKNVPNIITALRIILSVYLFFIEPFSIVFYILYIACGLSDVLDGYIARKTNTSSKLGSRMDTIADSIMVAVLFSKLLPIIRIPSMILGWIIVILIIRIVSIIIVYNKFHTFAILHTLANKATGIILFCFPIFYPIIDITALTYFICICASISAVEEFFIHLTSKDLLNDRKSIFHK
jgi:CDP-diacylglycerol--glycerol-3-phosphate 3-phosphatidyltransferase